MFINFFLINATQLAVTRNVTSDQNTKLSKITVSIRFPIDHEAATEKVDVKYFFNVNKLNQRNKQA